MSTAPYLFDRTHRTFLGDGVTTIPYGTSCPYARTSRTYRHRNMPPSKKKRLRAQPVLLNPTQHTIGQVLCSIQPPIIASRIFQAPNSALETTTICVEAHLSNDKGVLQYHLHIKRGKRFRLRSPRLLQSAFCVEPHVSLRDSSDMNSSLKSRRDTYTAPGTEHQQSATRIGIATLNSLKAQTPTHLAPHQTAKRRLTAHCTKQQLSWSSSLSRKSNTSATAAASPAVSGNLKQPFYKNSCAYAFQTLCSATSHESAPQPIWTCQRFAVNRITKERPNILP